MRPRGGRCIEGHAVPQKAGALCDAQDPNASMGDAGDRQLPESRGRGGQPSGMGTEGREDPSDTG